MKIIFDDEEVETKVKKYMEDFVKWIDKNQFTPGPLCQCSCL